MYRPQLTHTFGLFALIMYCIYHSYVVCCANCKMVMTRLICCLSDISVKSTICGNWQEAILKDRYARLDLSASIHQSHSYPRTYPPVTQLPSYVSTNHTVTLVCIHQSHSYPRTYPPITQLPSYVSTNHTVTLVRILQSHSYPRTYPPVTQLPSYVSSNHTVTLVCIHQSHSYPHMYL